MEETANSLINGEEASEKLRRWFLENKRDLPWRRDVSPYSVWISEVMLQQTRVDTVIDYFNRWMEKYPYLEAVAKASEEELIKMWEGLGYYSRVRAFKRGVEVVMKTFGGAIPSDYEELLQIPGIGPYTANAIRAFAFKQRGAAVDGNILRVFSRLFLVKDSIDKPSTYDKIQRLANKFIPEKDPQEVSEALIELGACICKKVPQCEFCPLASYCGALRMNAVLDLPIRSIRKKSISVFRYVFLISYKGEYCLVKRGEGELMRDLFEFPYVEISSKGAFVDEGAVSALCKELSKTEVTFVRLLPSVRQSFTNYRAWLQPILFRSKSHSPVFSHYKLEKISSLPLSSGHKKIFQQLIQL
ncbi:A/G-specific adenine glycosylase [Chlamydiifrater phoenicopteri]|uniref:A/G-specific adenine glycosylase n=1 Tax=Chlamydiifrater phoenicopteri TaxID=2681469 RepID=UPI001BD02814|nr:A/G-specific adenine glycosylase [Chlamydiifrater phoenicopteri]